MTYEPGQQVLVRATVQAAYNDHVTVFITNLYDGRFRLDVLTADVVGPAPATPDSMPDRFKGVIAFKVDLADGRTLVVHPKDVTIVTVNDDSGPAPATPDEGEHPLNIVDYITANQGLARQLVEARDALAAAEAERDDARAAVAQLQASLDGALRLNRALSVEAAGTEGGGGQ